MTDTSVTPDSQAIAKQVEDSAAAKVEELKSSLLTALSGEKREAPPESWSALKNETVDMAVSKAEERILSKIQDEKKKEAEQIQLTVKQQEEQVKAEWQRLTQEWNDAVADKILPDIAEPIKEKLIKGLQYNDLSSEEKADPGLVAYNESVALFNKLRQEGKAASFYRVADKFYNKQPAGAKAPVLGGKVSVPSSNSKGYTYAEVHALARKKFGR